MSATKRMMYFAQEIAEELDIPEPDYEDFEDVSDFIDENRQAFYASIGAMSWQR